MSIYEIAVSKKWKIDNHESDLYIEYSKEADDLTKNQKTRTFFTSQIDGKKWIEIPFGYIPFWDKVSKLSSGRC